MKKSLNGRYCLHQFAYWAASAGIITFATTFLLQKGFPASQVGLLMACGSILSGITQPILAAKADRSGSSILSRMMIILTGASTLCFALLLLTFLPRPFFALLYLTGVWLFDSMIPLMNSVSVYYNALDRPINYGLGRGVGSLAYSVSALVMGYILDELGPDWMIYIILILLPMCILIVLSYPNLSSERQHEHLPQTQHTTSPSSIGLFFPRYRWYCFSLLGILLLAMFHAMTENYLIVIMEHLGGNSRHVGIALFVATVVEAPVLFFFSRIRTRISDHWLLRLAGFSFLLKSILFVVAPSVPFIYGMQFLQMTSYGFLSPVQVYYANEKVAAEDMVKGQAFITASYTLGCAMGNLVGGQLLDFFDISAMLFAGVIIAAAGTLILLLTVEKKDAYRVTHI